MRKFIENWSLIIDGYIDSWKKSNLLGKAFLLIIGLPFGVLFGSMITPLEWFAERLCRAAEWIIEKCTK